MISRLLLSLSLIFSVQIIFAQLAVTPLNDQAAYDNAAQQLIGFGVTINNAIVNCGTDGIGLYTDESTIGGEGVLLTTGIVNGALGPNDSSGASTSSDNMLSDPELENIADGFGINDVCTFEFDVTVVGTVLDFDYVFASEEYPEFVCTQFNDTFGFFISGPNPDGGNYNAENIALINDEVVSINTINNGSLTNPAVCDCPCNSASYVDNTQDSDSPIQYDGFTQQLLATINTVPGATYHLKMGVADLSDSAFDTGVFISGGSFKSYGATSQACPSNVQATAEQDVCDGDMIELSVTFDGAGIVEWDLPTNPTTASGETIEFLASSITDCSETQNIAYTIVCTEDPTTIIEGSISVNIFVEPGGGLFYDEGACLVCVVLFCPEFSVIGGNNIPECYTADLGENVDVEFVVTNDFAPDGCTDGVSYPASLDCPENCAQVIAGPEDVDVCDGDMLSLELELDTPAVVDWHLPSGTYTQGESISFVATSVDGCNEIQEIGYTVVCLQDEAMAAMGSVTINVFAQPSATIDDNNYCVITVTPDCPDFVVIGQDDLGNPTFEGTTYEAQVSTEGTVTFEISNPTNTLDCHEVLVLQGNFECFYAGLAGNTTGIRLSPNPVRDYLFVDVGLAATQISVYDLNGKVVRTLTNPNTKVYLGDLNPSVYLVVIENESGVYAERVFVQRN